MAWSPDIATAFSLQGRVAVITGAASGLGQGAAQLLAQAGATVVLTDIDATGLEATAAQVRDGGGTAHLRQLDVTDRVAVEALAGSAAEYGGLDVWVNSAGIGVFGHVVDMPPDVAERIVAINLMGTYWACAAAGWVMAERGGGAIINLSSLAGGTPVPELGVYGMTKAGVEQLTRVAAIELGPQNVRVNAVAPGFIDTPINTQLYRDEAGAIDLVKREAVMREMSAMSPLGMVGEPMDIAFAILYLASDASRFVTGQILRVSGTV